MAALVEGHLPQHQTPTLTLSPLVRLLPPKVQSIQGKAPQVNAGLRGGAVVPACVFVCVCVGEGG